MSPTPPSTRRRSQPLRASARSVAEVMGALVNNRLAVALPVLLVLLLMAAVLAILALVPAISPFVYPLL